MSLLALPQPDVVVFGAGIIGLSIALELRSRGAQVTVIERDSALSQASSAAAGMLAAHDPHNPSALQSFSVYSLSLYDEFLQQIMEKSGSEVPYQTTVANQYESNQPAAKMQERSVDPRQLSAALLKAVRNSLIDLQEHSDETAPHRGVPIVHATGAWMRDFRVAPSKGQMLRVQLPADNLLTEVHRSEQVYVVPRTVGPQAGTALIGATIEDAGFDVTTHADSLEALRASATSLNKELEFLRDAPVVDSWAGLRPASRDLLPVIGQTDTRDLVATGHFRNGILLAPGTAKIIADLVEGKRPAIDISLFHPERFGL